MEYDITNTIAKHVREQADFDQDAEAHAEKLNQVTCIDQSLGRWIEMGVEFVFSALALQDHEFASRLPDLAHLTQPARRQFLRDLKQHLSQCRSCTITYEFEMVLNARIERACNENRVSLSSQLGLNTPAIVEIDLIEM